VNLRPVRLVGLPVAIHRRAAEHGDAVNRELSLIAAADDDSVPARLQALSEHLTAQYSAMSTAQREQLQEAMHSEAESIDLEYELPVEAADGAEELGRMLEEVDEYCRQGELLSLITPPDALAYRRWFLAEFARQLRDEAPPVPWADFAASESPEPPATAPDTVDGTPLVVELSGALDLEGATTFRPVLAEAVDNGAAHLVIDLADCDFVDSVGLSLLLTTRARCIELGGSLRVENLQSFVRTTFTHAGILELLTDPG
jgi:anti-anti-sigma factor